MSKQKRSRKPTVPRPGPLLAEQFLEQLHLLHDAEEAYDAGAERQAKTIAVKLRALLHDTGTQISLLEQLGIKDRALFTDTASVDPPDFVKAIDSGLAVFRLEALGMRYVAPLGDIKVERIRPPIAFHHWWTRPVLTDTAGHAFSRSAFVLEVANKEGGAHVDPQMDPHFDALERGNSVGVTIKINGVERPLENGPVPANIRQIAYEVEATIHREMPRQLPGVLPRAWAPIRSLPPQQAPIEPGDLMQVEFISPMIDLATFRTVPG